MKSKEYSGLRVITTVDHIIIQVWTAEDKE